MQIKLNAEADEFIRRAIETGRHRRPEDAVHEALDLWIERERRREELLAALDEGEASLARGEGMELTREAMRELIEDVKRRGREKVAAKRRARG
jgi:putative addiction module CopG family antidote